MVRQSCLFIAIATLYTCKGIQYTPSKLSNKKLAPKSAQTTLETRRAALALAAAALTPFPTLAAAPAGFVGGRSATAKAAPAFIERGLTFKNGRTMVITQAFGAARGSAKDDADAGDRTGTYAWPGGVALARYLVGAPATVRGRRVLELGCGTGAAGIMAKWLGARKVLLTDGSPAVLKNTELNVRRNARGGTAVSRLRWGYGDDIAKAGRKQWDLVIAAEVGYQRETLPALLDTIAALLADDGRALLQPGQHKRAKFPTSKAPFSADFHSFRLMFGRAIVSRNGLEAWMLFPERARAEHSR
jgi:predicted nicotinamide N-methyase